MTVYEAQNGRSLEVDIPHSLLRSEDLARQAVEAVFARRIVFNQEHPNLSGNDAYFSWLAQEAAGY